MEFTKEFLRAVFKDRISFVELDIENPDKVPVNPGMGARPGRTLALQLLHAYAVPNDGD